MADVEQRAEAEAAHKGLSGGAARAYVGGVFNRIRQAHSRGTQPGKGARHLQRKARVEARQEAKNRVTRHEQLAALEKQRLRSRTHREEPRKTSTPKRERETAATIGPLQPGYQPTARDYRNSGLIHDPDAIQGTRQPAPTPPQPAATGQAPKKVKPTPPQPIAGPDLDHFNPYATPTTAQLSQWYRREDLPTVLGYAPPEKLRERVAEVEQSSGKRYTGSKANKRQMIAFIMEHV